VKVKVRGYTIFRGGHNLYITTTHVFTGFIYYIFVLYATKVHVHTFCYLYTATGYTHNSIRTTRD
jgi:hypothetical protein